jgi:hypothetical protein
LDGPERKIPAYRGRIGSISSWGRVFFGDDGEERQVCFPGAAEEGNLAVSLVSVQSLGLEEAARHNDELPGIAWCGQRC